MYSVIQGFCEGEKDRSFATEGTEVTEFFLIRRIGFSREHQFNRAWQLLFTMMVVKLSCSIHYHVYLSIGFAHAGASYKWAGAKWYADWCHQCLWGLYQARTSPAL